MSTDYDLAVIGAGSAGLTAAGIAASLGIKTLLIEKDRFGGDCTWTGCVPSKTLLAQAKKVHTASQVTNKSPEEIADFSQIMQKVQSVQEDIFAEADSPEALQKFGVDVLQGRAEFTDSQTLTVDTKAGTQEVSASYIFIATGAGPVIPPIEGLNGVDYLTSDNLFTLTEQPSSLVIIGGGPIGVEMAQAFNRLGTTVHVIESAEHILPNDTRLSKRLQSILQNEGVQLHTDARAQKVTSFNGGVSVTTTGSRDITGDKLLLAVGRSPNTDALNLSQVGVETKNAGGIKTTQYGRTNQRNIFAVGDVTGGPQFTHQSEYEAKRAVFKAFFSLPLPADRLTPRVTYTDPELATVGKSRRQLEAVGTNYDTYEFPYRKLDRANTDDRTNGGIIVYTENGGSSVLGAHVLGPRAGELVSEIGLAIQNDINLRNIAQTVHPYPSYGLGVRRLADQYVIQNQPAWLIRVAKFIFGYRGDVLQPNSDEVI